MDNVFHNAENGIEEEHALGATFPVIWKKELPDLVFDVPAGKDDTVLFFGCQIVVHSVRGIDFSARSLDPVFDLYNQASYMCAVDGTSVDKTFPKNSIKSCDAICVVYGLMTHPDQKSMPKMPLGFATLLNGIDGIKGAPWASYSVYAKPGVVVKAHLYIDLICSAFSMSGVGRLIIDELGDSGLRRAMRDHMGFSYDGLALRSLPATYSYFAYKCGFVRSNGNGEVYPFTLLTSAADGTKIPLYTAADVDSAELSVRKILDGVRPLKVFKTDSDSDGYMFHKPLGPVSGGGRRRRKI